MRCDRFFQRLTVGSVSFLVFAATGGVFADVISITPCKDNTLIETVIGSENSNGMGNGIYSGRVGAFGNGARLRAVLAFDLGAIPAGSTINSVTLTLQMLHTTSGDQTHTLHRVQASWGEGASMSDGGSGAPAEPGDATWLNRFFPGMPWTTAGGDYNAAASASQVVGFGGSYSWSSAGMTADVQAWLANPATNFGWIVIGNETVTNTAKQFASKENKTVENWPQLQIDFTPPANPCPADTNHDSSVNVTDLLAVINGWGACPSGCPVVCPADVNHDTSVNVSDLLAVINGWGACP